jgi:hypothetical protein
MQVNFATHPPIGVEGQLWGTDHESRPFELPQRAQITEFELADGSAAAGEAWTIVATDEDTGQTFTLEFTSGATVALTLAALTAAASLGQFRNLFSAVDDASTIATWTARNKGKTYSFTTTTGGGTGTNTATVTQTAIDYNAAGLPFGRAVVRGAGDMEMAEIGAASVVGDIIGVLFRTDGNAFHSFESDSLADVDSCERASHQRVLCRGTFLALVEEAVTPASRVWVRRALTSSAGRLGGFRDSPAGTAEVATITVVADHQVYSVKASMLVNGVSRELEFQYAPTDGTTTTDLAIDGLEAAAAAAIAAQGFTGLVTASAASAAATMTLTTLAGTVFEYVDGIAFNEDTPAEALEVVLTSTDADAIDCSAIFAYESSAAAGELAVVRVKGLV